MPRVKSQVKNKAGKARHCGRCGREIKPGEAYFKWSFRYGGTHYRCSEHPPRRSETTQSKLSEVYAAVEDAENTLGGVGSVEDVRGAVEAVAEQVRSTADEYREADEAFGGQGATQSAEYADELEGWADELEGFYPDEPVDDATDEEKEEALENARSEAEQLLGECPL